MQPTLVLLVIVCKVHTGGDVRGIREQMEKWTHKAQSGAVSFIGKEEEEDVNLASTAFTTMISQH